MILRTPQQSAPKPIPRDLPLVVWVTADDDAAEEPALTKPRAYLLGGLALLATLLVITMSLLDFGGWEALTATFTFP